MISLTLPVSVKQSYQSIYDKVNKFEVRFYQVAKELELSPAYAKLQPNYSGSYPALPLKKYMLAEFINQLQIRYRPTTSRLLDLGAANGKTLGTLVSLLEIEGVGIEARTYECTFGSAILAQMSQEGWFGKHNCKLHLGNYFPTDFIIDNEIKWGKNISPFVLNKFPEKDVYDEIGFNISDFDIIYAYQFSVNFHSTMTLVGQQASPGTLVVLPGAILEKNNTYNITLEYESDLGFIGRVE